MKNIRIAMTGEGDDFLLVKDYFEQTCFELKQIADSMNLHFEYNISMEDVVEETLPATESVK